MAAILMAVPSMVILWLWLLVLLMWISCCRRCLIVLSQYTRTIWLTHWLLTHHHYAIADTIVASDDFASSPAIVPLHCHPPIVLNYFDYATHSWSSAIPFSEYFCPHNQRRQCRMHCPNMMFSVMNLTLVLMSSSSRLAAAYPFSYSIDMNSMTVFASFLLRSFILRSPFSNQ